MIEPPIDKTPRDRTTVALLCVLGAIVLGFAVCLIATGRVGDFGQFILDRREGAGQTTPDTIATCSYQIIGARELQVERKAHGQKNTETHALADTFVEAFYGTEQALFETASTADTYNCINGEYVSQPLIATHGDPISRVLFSASGRNLAIVLNEQGREDGVSVFKFTVDKGQSTWNAGFNDGKGINGPVRSVTLVGESLVVVLEVEGQSEIHTYNFRRSHLMNPWNEQSTEHQPFIPEGQFSDVTVDENGRVAEISIIGTTSNRQYQFDFTCKLTADPGAVVNKRPCEWRLTNEFQDESV